MNSSDKSNDTPAKINTTSLPINIVDSSSNKEEDNLEEEEDEYDSEDSDDFIDPNQIGDDETESSNSFIECLSPPPNSRTLKRISKRTKKHQQGSATAVIVTNPITNRKYKTKPKKPPLVNSAMLHTSEVAAGSDTTPSSLNDSTFLHEDKPHYQQMLIEDAISKELGITSTQAYQRLNITSSHPSSVNPWFAKPQNSQIDPFDRDDVREKIDRLLKLALKHHNDNQLNQDSVGLILQNNSRQNKSLIAPPSTPLSSSPSTSYKSSISYNVNLTSQNDNMFIDAAISKHTEPTRKRLHTQLWKELYDYFEYYDDRAESFEQIDKRIEIDRAKIPVLINDILATDFSKITRHMEQEIDTHMQTPAHFALLASHTNYIDQLCYIYWLVEDTINQIGYVESLYSSTKELSASQPAYADPRFEATSKTLVLWYKMMSDLMEKSDLLGHFLGFTRRPESKAYWPWFHTGLKYSRDEYIKISSKIQSLLQQQNSSAFSGLCCMNRFQTNSFLFPTAEVDSANAAAFRKPERQISYILDASKSSFNVAPILTSQHSMTDISLMNMSNHSGSNIVNNSIQSPGLNLLDNGHLKSVKLHHMNSFLSRSSSYLSLSDSSSITPPLNIMNHLQENQSPAPLSSSFYNELHQLNELNNENDSISFNLNDTAAEATMQQAAESLSNIPNFPPNAREVVEAREKVIKEFLRKRLRKHGLKRTYNEVSGIILHTLSYALQALQIDRCARPNENHFYYHLMPLHQRCAEYLGQFPLDEEKVRYGVKSDTFLKLGLPSFRTIYLYLNNVILSLMHICIKMQIENNSDIKNATNFKYSLLSIEVLTNECRECIEQAILVRQFYYHMVYSVMEYNEMDVQKALESDLVEYDNDLKEIILIYLKFVTDWVHDLVLQTNDLPKALWVLNDEWKFCKNNLFYVTDSENMYAKSFCTMSGFLNESVLQILKRIDTECKQKLMEYNHDLLIKIDIEDNYEDNSSEPESNAAETKANFAHDEGLNIINEEEEDPEANQAEEQLDDLNSQNSDEDEEAANIDSDDVNEENLSDVILRCNELKEEINRLRKISMKSLKFCGKLIGDLELAAKYDVTSSVQDLLNELAASNHVQLVFTNPEFSNSAQSSSFMLFIPNEFSKEKVQIIRLLFIISEKDDYEPTSSYSNNNNGQQQAGGENQEEDNYFNQTVFRRQNEKANLQNPSTSSQPMRRLSSSNSFYEPWNNDQLRNTYLTKLSHFANIRNLSSGQGTTSTTSSPLSAFLISPNTSVDGYLLYLRLPLPRSGEPPQIAYRWPGQTVQLFASMPVRYALYQHNSKKTDTEPNLILVTSKQSILKTKRVELKTKLKGSISLNKEKTSFHPNIESALDDLKDNILELRRETSQFINSIEKDLKDSRYFKAIDHRYLNEIWRVCYTFGIELHNDCIKFMTHDRSEKFSLGLADFSIMWCDYIVNRTEKGKGTTVRPWAAKKGIQLIQLAIEHSVNLKNEDFIRLIKAVEKCMVHVIGDRSNLRRFLNSSQNYYTPPINESASSRVSISTSEQAGKSYSLRRSSSQIGRANLNPTIRLKPRDRFKEACERTDNQRETILLQRDYIGKIINIEKSSELIQSTEVSFRWQLGLLIGKGSFGNVYSCVNLDTGEPLALKIIPFKPNDVKNVKEIADEINNVKDIDHENLVKFYGAELHRKEILIFMEFCGDQCTLEKLCSDQSGLPEKLVRDYTKSLLRAVDALHERHIMHGDIKGANIFLKIIDPKHPERVVLKLGDFGCSIKFKDPIDSKNTNVKATAIRGTFFWMSPEIMAKSGVMDGKNEVSSDIWSLGCVVIEMFNGKRPWHPISEGTIMYKIHITGEMKKPPYPTTPISEEAVDFLNHCLEFDPNDRFTADRLLDHPFVKVALTDDNYFSI